MAMIKRMVMACACTAALTVASTTAMATTYTWTGLGTTSTVAGTTYGNWTDNGSWNPNNGYPSSYTADAVMNAVSSPANNASLYAGADFGISNSSAGIGKMASLTLTGGTLQISATTTTILKYPLLGAGTVSGSGRLTQTGGTFFMNNGELRMGAWTNAGGGGLYDISGGMFSTRAEDGNKYPGGVVALNRSNQVAGSAQTAELRISGNATVNLAHPTGSPAQSVVFGAGGGGLEAQSILSVIGPNATINIDSISMANSNTARSGLIKFSFTESGVSTIHLTGAITGTTVAANLTQGYIDMDYTGTPLTAGDTFTLMNVTSGSGTIAMSGSTFGLLASDTTNWQLQLTNNSQTLQAVYVPEPSAAMLLSFAAGAGVFVIGKLNRRRNARASRAQA